MNRSLLLRFVSVGSEELEFDQIASLLETKLAQNYSVHGKSNTECQTLEQPLFLIILELSTGMLQYVLCDSMLQGSVPPVSTAPIR